jgi:predicted Zn-dependent protease
VNQQGQVGARVLLYIIEYAGNNYAMLGASSPTDFNGYFNTFQSVIKSFNVLNDPEKLNRQPDRIRIKQVGQSATLAQLLKSYNQPDKKMEEIAVLNGMKLTDVVNSGTLIKVIEK